MNRPASLDVVPALCHVRPSAGEAQSLLRLMAEQAVEQGYARPSFPDAVVAREKEFPTGLPTPVPVAIPHSDPEHVLRPGLAVAYLDPPVEFVEMASDGTTLPCRLAVMLLVTSPPEQVEVLNRVVGVFQDPTWPERLGVPADAADLADRFAGLLA